MLDNLLESRATRILDCACGAGGLAIWLALNGKSVWAFDVSPNAITIAKESAQLSGVSERVSFQVMDARHLDYEDEFVHVITGTDCIHHLIEYRSAITSLTRVLRVGARGFL